MNVAAAQPKVGPNRGNAGKGRPKGVPNKQNAAIKDMIIAALHGVGGEKYLIEQAEKNPNAFIGLVGKVLPMQLTGEGGGALSIVVTTGVPRDRAGS